MGYNYVADNTGAVNLLHSFSCYCLRYETREM